MTPERCISVAHVSPGPRGGTQAAAAMRHVGLYAYRVWALQNVHAAPPCGLELQERLEQLRALWLGIGIRVAPACEDPPREWTRSATLSRCADSWRSVDRRRQPAGGRRERCVQGREERFELCAFTPAEPQRFGLVVADHRQRRAIVVLHHLPQRRRLALVRVRCRVSQVTQRGRTQCTDHLRSGACEAKLGAVPVGIVAEFAQAVEGIGLGQANAIDPPPVGNFPWRRQDPGIVKFVVG